MKISDEVDQTSRSGFCANIEKRNLSIMKFEKDFKLAIKALPMQEKDKLILRLLKKDLALANRLRFELLSTESVDEKRADMEARIKAKVENINNRFYSPGYFMMYLRNISGEINEHVYTTKDKFGEASLNLLMLNEALSRTSSSIDESSPRKKHKLCIYIIARAFKILILVQALDEDYFIEFKEPLIQLGEFISSNQSLMKTAINNGFEVNWLLRAEIPEDIKEIHKSVRAQGFLR